MHGFEILIPILAILTGGAIILLPLLAICARFALKPVLQALIEFRDASAGAQSKLPDPRVELLEAEVWSLRSAVEELKAAEDFRRQLESGTVDGPAR
jgi:hypothetical protein